jgi:hypothetical protein
MSDKRVLPGELEAAAKAVDNKLQEVARLDVFMKTSKQHFDDFINFVPEPYYGTGKKGGLK